MTTLEELQSYKYTPPEARYLGPTTYMNEEIPTWSHPATIALGILNRLYHRRFQGAMIIGTMGDGKTVLATTLAHQIHKHASEGIKVPIVYQEKRELRILQESGALNDKQKERLDQLKGLVDHKRPEVEEKLVQWDFKVVWAGPHEFTHQEEFYKNLPKFPTIVIYDDISGALKQIGEKQMEANFSTLSEIRWKLDPQTGMIPCIVIVLYHYSKNLEKEFRSVLGMDTIFTEISNEERSNIDTIAPKGTLAHTMMENFDKMSQPMINEHRFHLFLGNGKKLEYFTDQPFRCACAITKNDGKLILFSHKDNCDQCVKRKRRYTTSVEVIYNEMMGLGYGEGYTKKAMEMALEKRGYEVFHPYFRYATNYFENKIMSRYEFDLNELRNYILSQDHKSHKPIKKNRKVTKEKESLDRIEQKATLIEEKMSVPDKPEVADFKERNDVNDILMDNIGYKKEDA